MNVEIWQKSLSSITYISKKYALIIPLFSTENVEIWDEKPIPTIYDNISSQEHGQAFLTLNSPLENQWNSHNLGL